MGRGAGFIIMGGGVMSNRQRNGLGLHLAVPIFWGIIYFYGVDAWSLVLCVH